MPIDPLPTPVPTRDDPANFAARGDAFLAALPTFATQAEAARQQIEQVGVDAQQAADNAAASEQVAAAAANYKGEYSSSVTYAKGDAVSYGGDRWVAKQTALNKTPSDGSAYWLRIIAIPGMAGQSGKFLTTDGSAPAWGVPVEAGYLEFTASNASWTKPTCKWMAVHCVGAGGGGGRGATICPGAGGSGWFLIFRAEDLPSTIAIVVGAGGAKNNSGDGANGGNSSFNGIVASGGAGGATGIGVYASFSNGYKSAATMNSELALINHGLIPGMTFEGAASNINSGMGADAIYGGAGGGGVTENSRTGTSLFAGNGGAGTADGVAPGGGGGASSSGCGNGARGAVRVWWW